MCQNAEDLTYSILVTDDPLTPIKRLDALIDTLSIDRNLLELTLLALEAIDLTVTKLLVEGVLDSSRNFYVFEDKSVKLLLDHAMRSKVQHAELIECLILLNETDLIFRFTAARKFGVSNLSAKQLRINSWGKLYIQERGLIAQQRSIYAEFTTQVQTSIESNKGAYQELVQLLSQPIQPDIASRIAGLNTGLAVKLLS